MILALIAMVQYIIWIIIVAVIIQFILSLLISFNVVNIHNNAVAAIWKALNAILDPILKPIRRILPDTGVLDLSPMVLIIGLNLVDLLLRGIARDLGYLT